MPGPSVEKLITPIGFAFVADWAITIRGKKSAELFESRGTFRVPSPPFEEYHANAFFFENLMRAAEYANIVSLGIAFEHLNDRDSGLF